MITCKEDLIGTYIENDRGELRDLYLSKCEEFEIYTNSGKNPSEFARLDKLYIGISPGDNGVSYSNRWSYKARGCKQLTISDLKHTKQSTAVETLEQMGYEWKGGELWKPPVRMPKVEVEYIKVIDSIFDLRDEFERGELYFAANGDIKNMRVIESELHLVQLLKSQMEFTDRAYIYRRTEKQVDWRDACLNFLCSPSDMGPVFCDLKIKDSESSENYSVSTALSESEFLELCRVALRARGEL